ncbi:MAG: ATP-binding protein [Clostridia bacterium]|nr:ATP-binding protein [Clostridia bacterium]
MFYFREEEFHQLSKFLDHSDKKAMAVYGKRRTGKTRLLTEYIGKASGDYAFLYYQCTSYDYQTCLKDFLSVARSLFPNDSFLSSMPSFRETIALLSKLHPEKLCIIIDEFPFLAKKNENVTVEFQWIIDHGLGADKLILSGSNLSFMKKQIGDREAPLYGRFDEIMEVRPFTFRQVQSLFPSPEDAMMVYSMTGGVAQYVVFFLDYSSVREATASLFFSPDGRLIREAPNMLLQELRDPTTYEQILRAIGGNDKSTPQVADRSGIDNKTLFPYLTRLQDLYLVAPVANPLSTEKKKQRFRITDALFRFHYTFIEPNMSMINALQEKAIDYILDHRYQEFIGITYEDIVLENTFQYALDHVIPFMPHTTGKWWGPVCIDNAWMESEVDLVAYDDCRLLVGECKYRSKAVGMQELDHLKLKAQFIPSKGRELFYLLASKSGFTEEVKALRDSHIILIDRV